MSAQEEVIRTRPVFSTVPLARILAGQRHAPIVYFAQMGLTGAGEQVVKIGTTTNLQARMRTFYVPLRNVLALVPGGRETEQGYHRLFAEYAVHRNTRELFRVSGRLKRFLASQAEGTCDDLPSFLPMLVRTAPETGAPESPQLPAADRSAPVSLLMIVRMFLLPHGTAGEQKNLTHVLRQDRYRSDRSDLPGDLVFPEPAEVADDGRQTELFVPHAVIEFNQARRGRRVA